MVPNTSLVGRGLRTGRRGGGGGDRGHARLVWSLGRGRGGHFVGTIQDYREARLHRLHLLTSPLLLQQLVVQDGGPDGGRHDTCQGTGAGQGRGTLRTLQIQFYGGGRGGYLSVSIQDLREARLRPHLLTLPLLLRWQLVVQEGGRCGRRHDTCRGARQGQGSFPSLLK